MPQRTHALDIQRITLMKSALSRLLHCGHGLKPAPTLDINPTSATSRITSFATEITWQASAFDGAVSR
jgi:hypothetical protein